MTLTELLNSGGVLRYSPAQRFYGVRQGVTYPVDQTEAQKAVKSGLVRPEGGKADQHGVWHFTKSPQQQPQKAKK